MTRYFSSKPAQAAFATAAFVLLAACAEPSSTEEGAPNTPVEVGVVQVQEQVLQLTDSLPGRTAAYRVAQIRPQVNGVIKERLFTEGAEVAEGEQLYQIDDAVYQAQYGRAQANLAAAERLAKRYERLQKTKAISRQQYDDAMAAWKQAQAEVELARINLQYTKVLSPISGRIGRSAVTEGALVTNGQPQALATVQQLDPIYVDLTQSVPELLELRKLWNSGRLERAGEGHARVRLVLEDGSTYPMDGKLQFSEVTVDPATSSVVLRAEFPNPDGTLLPGMFVRAELVQGERPDAILVPQQAVQRDPTGQAHVWVVEEDGTVRRQTVETARTVGNQWLISSGLSDGETIVTEGLQRVRDGMTVAVTPASNVQTVMDFSESSATTADTQG